MIRIVDFYQEMKVPRNLQRHMLRVAAMGQYVAQNWIEPIDEKVIVETLLLHDMGNLLKFNLSQGVSLFDVDEMDVEYWKSVQNDLRVKFSADEHEATQMMAKSLKVSDRTLFLLKNMGSSNLSKTVESQDWELKICSYSDFRVSPYGFTTVKERFEDILRRYEGSSHALSDKEKTLEKMRLCTILEEQLQAMCGKNIKDTAYNLLEEMSQDLRLIEVG